MQSPSSGPDYAKAWSEYVTSDEGSPYEAKTLDEVVRIAAARLPELTESEEGGAVLDFGCGIGSLIRPLVKRVSGFRYVPIDSNPVLLSKAVETSVSAGVETQGLVLDLSSEDAIRDLSTCVGVAKVIFCVRILNYLPDDAARELLGSFAEHFPDTPVVVVDPTPGEVEPPEEEGFCGVETVEDFGGVELRRWVRSSACYVGELRRLGYDEITEDQIFALGAKSSPTHLVVTAKRRARD